MARLKKTKNESGYSLIEMLIVVTLVGLCLLAAMAFVLRIQLASLAYGQRDEANDRSRVVTSQLKKDFENLGINLNGVSVDSQSGAISNSFIAHPDYQISGSETSAAIMRTGFSQNSYLLSALNLVGGSGEIAFTPHTREGIIGWQNETETRGIYLNSDGEFGILENDQVVVRRTDTTFDKSRSEDRFVISLNREVYNNCYLSYYRIRGEERQLLYKSSKNCPDYPLQSFVGISDKDRLADVHIKGGSLEPVPGTENDFAGNALLPTLHGVRLNDPVLIDNREEFTLLQSDILIDSVNLLKTAQITENQSEVTLEVAKPLRGKFVEGDGCLLADFKSQKSVFGKITKVEESFQKLLISLLPFTAEFSDHGIYSLPGDYKSHEFDSRSRLIRLLPPIKYKLFSSSGTEGRVLARRSGSDSWENIAFGINSFAISRGSESNRTIFYLRFDLAVEDEESTEPLRNKFTISPRGLNIR